MNFLVILDILYKTNEIYTAGHGETEKDFAEVISG